MYAIEKDTSSEAAVKSVLKRMLSQKLVDALFVPSRTPYSQLPMPTLISDPEEMESIAPLAPVAPFNAARQAATLLKNPAGKLIALVLRPCEIRALVELAKLNQCTIDHVVLIGIDCLGRMENSVYLEKISDNADLTKDFYKKEELQSQVAQACKACEHFQPKGVDVTISLIETDDESAGFAANTETGTKLLKDLDLSTSSEPKVRATTLQAILEKRIATRDSLFEETAQKTNTIEGFQKLIANCLNCYNCRSACPVCYCKECVFLTDVFAHRPETLLRRASKRGMVKMPADTSMFHMTRLAHMSHACVGCGHCSSVCPSDIPVADIFRTVSAKTQELFEYEPGRDVSEPIPYLAFEEDSDKE